jgi:ribokinase
VLGSLNMDILVTVPRLPAPGVTVLGDAARFTPGGKGANQAVAAARLGGRVRMIGAVGDDAFGRQLTDALRAEDIDATGVAVLGAAPTGLAMITVDAAGENIITVAGGANRLVTDAMIPDGGYDALIISAEIPVRAIRAALSRARASDRTSDSDSDRARASASASASDRAHAKTAAARPATPASPGPLCLLNLAPAPPEAAAIVAEGVDWLVVNESEAAAILNRPVSGLAEARDAAVALTKSGARNAVVTAGSHGAAVAGAAVAGAGRDAATVEGFHVKAIDSVGAGDTFVGALAVTLASGVPPYEAIRAASAAAATAVTRPGAQAAMPRPADIEAVTALTWPHP